MLISGVNIYNPISPYYKKRNDVYVKNTVSQNKTLNNNIASQDLLSLNNITKREPHRNINFLGGFVYINNTLKTQFTTKFFKKLAQEHLPCAYTGLEMIPRSSYDELIKTEALKKRGPVAIKFLKKFKNSMFETEKNIFTILETESKKHPELKLQELLQLKFPAAEQTLINQQSDVLNKINLMIRNLPTKEFQATRVVIKEAFDKIFTQNQLPENRFMRKDFIIKLKALNFSDQQEKNKILEVAEMLPNSENSINAFIVKYSQPYKTKIDENGNLIKIPRDSEELGLRLLQPSLASDEHIYPQTLYNKEDLAREKGNKAAQNLSASRVTILTTEKINNMKSDMLLDDFIKICPFDIKTNVQKHIDSLIHISQVWMKKGQIEDSYKLTEYIKVLKEEFQRRSKEIKIDTTELDKILPEIEYSYKNNRLKQITEKPSRVKVQKASNNHKAHQINSNGQILENRKVQKHSSRFSN